MQSCNLVTLAQLQPKLLDLIPTAQKAQAHQPNSTSQRSVQLTCLGLFKKILTSSRDEMSLESDQLEQYFKMFMPLIINILDRSHPDEVQVKCQCLHTLSEVTAIYPALLLHPLTK